MLGRQENMCQPSVMDEKVRERYSRCIFEDMKIAISLLKSFNDQLVNLHPDVYYKIKQLL